MHVFSLRGRLSKRDRKAKENAGTQKRGKWLNTNSHAGYVFGLESDLEELFEMLNDASFQKLHF